MTDALDKSLRRDTPTVFQRHCTGYMAKNARTHCHHKPFGTWTVSQGLLHDNVQMSQVHSRSAPRREYSLDTETNCSKQLSSVSMLVGGLVFAVFLVDVGGFFVLFFCFFFDTFLNHERIYPGCCLHHFMAEDFTASWGKILWNTIRKSLRQDQIWAKFPPSSSCF